MELPRGFRFNPFEEELITFYLKPKVLGLELPSNAVEDRQLYGPNANPWQLFDPDGHSWILSEVSPGKFEKLTYVFVNLTKKSKMKKASAAKENYTKKAGCGTWDGQTKRHEIRDRITGDLIGDKRFLVFEINDVCGLDLGKVGYWKMHEFHLCGINEHISNPANIVLCRITLDHSKAPPVKLKNVKPQNNKTPNQAPVSQEKQGDDGIHSADSPSEELNTANLKPQYSGPAAFDNQCRKKIKEESGRGKFLFGMTKVQLSGHSKPDEEDSVEDITTNLGKRKFKDVKS